jgi:hypothetical protein
MRSKPLHATPDVHLSPVFVGSVIICCESSQSIIEEFTNMDVVTLRSIPVIAYTRMFYAIIILTKMTVCTQSGNSGIGKIMNGHSIRQTEYMYKAMTTLQTAAGNEHFKVPSTFLSIITKLAAWCHQQQAQSHINGCADEILIPMAHMKSINSVSDSELTKVSQESQNRSSESENFIATAITGSETLDYGFFTNNTTTAESQIWAYSNFQQTPELSSAIKPLDRHFNESKIYDRLDLAQKNVQAPQLDQDIAQMFHDFPDFDMLASMDRFEDSAMLKFATDGNNLTNIF